MTRLNAHGWEDGDAFAKETGGGNILKLENNGDKALVVFDFSDDEGRGVYAYSNLFIDGASSIDLSTTEGQEYLAKHPDAKKDARWRGRVGCFVLATGTSEDDVLGNDFAMKCASGEISIASLETSGSFWEIGKTVFGALKRWRKKRPFGTYIYEVERHGAAKDPKTTYNIFPDRPIDEIRGLREHLDHVAWKYLPDPFDKEESGKDSKPGKSAKPGKPKKTEGKAKLSAEDMAWYKETFGQNRGLIPAALASLGISSPKELTPEMMPRLKAWFEKEITKNEIDDDMDFGD